MDLFQVLYLRMRLEALAITFRASLYPSRGWHSVAAGRRPVIGRPVTGIGKRVRIRQQRTKRESFAHEVKKISASPRGG